MARNIVQLPNYLRQFLSLRHAQLRFIAEAVTGLASQKISGLLGGGNLLRLIRREQGLITSAPPGLALQQIVGVFDFPNFDCLVWVEHGEIAGSHARLAMLIVLLLLDLAHMLGIGRRGKRFIANPRG